MGVGNLVESLYPQYNVEGQVFNIHRYLEDIYNMRNDNEIFRISMHWLAEGFWQMFQTGADGRWIPSRSQRMCPSGYKTLYGRKGVIPTAISSVLKSATLTGGHTGGHIPLLRLMIGGTFVVERTTRCPTGRKRIYRKGETINVPTRPPFINETFFDYTSRDISNYLSSIYFVPTDKYVMAANAGVSGTPMMSGMTRAEESFHGESLSASNQSFLRDAGRVSIG